MMVKDFIVRKGWNESKGKDADIIISSRIRLARNFAGLGFANTLNEAKRKDIIDSVANTIANAAIQHFSEFNMSELSDIEKTCLVERHLISVEHAKAQTSGAVFISDDEHVSIMVNEEDHLRIQVISGGLNLMEDWKCISNLDDLLESGHDYAFSSQVGYLTACPTNVGTGMRASVMLHLPCLVMTKQIQKIFEAIAKLGLTIRGLYGEGSASAGNLFQISNQVTLGLAEEEIIDNLKRIILQVIDHEKKCREELYANNAFRVQDKVCRAFGLLKYAKTMSFSETINLLSYLWLGVGLGIFDEALSRIVDELFIVAQPAHIQMLEGKVLIPEIRDIKRADLLRNRLKNLDF